MTLCRRAIVFSLIGFCLAAWASAQETPYGVGKWDEALGNHRARIQVDQAAPAVLASIPWRRCDLEVEKKDVLVIDGKSGTPVANRVVAAISRERGDIVFQAAAPGEYFVYYMPCNPGRSAFPTARYNPPKETAAGEWLAANRLRKEDLARGDWSL